MPLESADDGFLWDMWEAATAVAQMVAGMTLQEYRGDRRTRRAVEREIEIIGEAARSISDQFKKPHPHIPWSKIIAQRHKLAHEYAEIQDDIIWTVATVHIPELIAQLEPLVAQPPTDDQ